MKPTLLVWFFSAVVATAQQYAFTNLAGLPGTNTSSTGFANGAGTLARFDYPSGLAVDALGNVYVGDRRNQLVRKVSPQGVVSILAGTPLTEGTNDGPGTQALFSYPFGVAVDAAGNVYVSDRDTNTIRLITRCRGGLHLRRPGRPPGRVRQRDRDAGPV